MFRSGHKSLLVLFFVLVGSVPLAAYYYFPDHQPPGPPPNYNQIDPTYFYGVPPLSELPPSEMGGYFVYFDSTEDLWTINTIVESGTSTYEQFHGSILVQLDQEPEPGVNVWPLGFDLTEDLHRNDRWGWARWSDSIAPNLYEIWWDITIDCPGAAIGCSRTIGFWKTHAGFGPQADMVTPLLPIWLGTPGGDKSLQVTTAQMAVDILSMDVYGAASNGITKLYAQLLGAKLNIASGASGDDIAGIIAAADALLAEYNWKDWLTLSRRDRRAILDWMSTLDEYSNGEIGPGHCEDIRPDDDSYYSGDSVCIIGISFKGCAFDFNLWGSSYNRQFSPNIVYLGGEMVPLLNIPEFEDTFMGISDSYGHPFDCDPPTGGPRMSKRRVADLDCLEPNRSTFTPVMMPGAAYNVDGFIELGTEYGDAYGGSRVYEGNGIQFGVYDCEENNPPTFEPPVGYLKPLTLCLGSTIYDTIIANDFDFADTVTLVKLSGPGDFSSTPDVPPVYGYFIWTPTETGSFAVVFQATDNHGATVIDSIIYNITFNQPPMAYATDTTVFVCWEADEICYTVIGDDAESDPLTFSLLSGAGAIDAATGELCFIPGGDGQYPFSVEVADTCGTDTVDFTISVLTNRNPIIKPYNSLIAVCEIDTVCFPVEAFDPDTGDSLEITLLDGPGVFTATGSGAGLHCFLPDILVGGTYVFHYEVTDECWREAIADGTAPSDPPRDSIVITVELNQSPAITCPDDVFASLCEPDTLCYEITAIDPDGDELTYHIISGPGSIDPVTGIYCVYADGAGLFSATVMVTDICGHSDTCTINITVELNSPPETDIPDTSLYLCEPGEVCIPYDAFDPDGNIVNISAISAQGVPVTVSDGQLCFTPESAGTYTITITVTDACGETATDQATVIIGLNQEPLVQVGDTSLFLCDPAEVCLPVTMSDPDGTIDSVVVSEPAYYDADNQRICLEVGETGTYGLVIVVYDDCGVSATDTGVAAVTLNSPPVVIGQADTSLALCEPEEICLEFFDVTDPDNNIVSIEYFPPLGKSVPPQYCFTPDTAGTYCVIATATDECGAVGADTVCVTVTFNSPPEVIAPEDTAVFQCDPAEICLEGFVIADPDANIASLEFIPAIGVFDDGSYCFMPDTAGTYCIIARAIDSCGVQDEDTVCVIVTFGEDVAITCPPFPVMDTLCSPDTVCVDIPVEPASALISILEPGAIYEDGRLCAYIEKTGVYAYTLVAEGECNADTCLVILNIKVDEGPEITCPAPDPVHLCDSDSISVPVEISPASAMVTILPPAIYADGMLTFWADASGQYCFQIIAANDCGADTCNFCVDVTLDSPPVVSIADSAFQLCQLQEVCVPYEYSDPDNNVTSVRVSTLKTIYKLVDGKVCFTPPAAGTYDIVLIVTDSCGLSGSDTATIEVALNTPPSVVVGDTTVFTCDATEICLPVTAFDVDGSVVSIEAHAPAYYDEVNGAICLPVTESGVYRMGVTVYDDCGESATDTGVAIVTFNSPPEVTVPHDTAVFQCEPQEICLAGFDVFDIDDNVTSMEFIPDIGTYAGGQYCFMPDTAGTYCLVFRATDACGLIDEDTVCVSYEAGTDVVIDCPDGVQPAFLCGPDSVCIEIAVSPPGAIITILEPGAVYENGRLCFYAETSGEYTYTMVATGECGSDTCTVTFAVTIDEPPQIVCPPSDSIHLCEPDTIIIPIPFTPETALITVTPPGVYENGQFKFYPVEPGEYCFTVIVENDCGADTCTFCITVTFDSPPQVSLADSSVYLCELEQICIPVDIVDPDDNIVDIDVTPIDASLVDGSVCFAPTGAGTYEISVTVVDACGNSATDTAVVTVELNQGPSVDVGDDSFFLCEPSEICLPVVFDDPDGVIDSIIVTAPAYYDADNQRVCVAADEPGTYDITVTVYDDCGASASDIGSAVVTFNTGPTVTLPADSSVFLCDPGDICVPVAYGDDDGNIASVDLIPPDYDLVNDTICFFADASGMYQIILTVTDSCGATAADTMKVTVSLNQPPVVIVGDSTLFACGPTTVCLPVEGFDPDGTIDSIIVDAPAYYDAVNERVCVPVETPGNYPVIVTVYDNCAAWSADTGTVAVSFNVPPTVVAPSDTAVFVCELSEICLEGFVIYDPDDNIHSIDFEPPLGSYAEGSYCFTPVSDGQQCFIVRVTDECGEMSEDTVCVTIELGDDVVLTCPGPQTVGLCAPDSVCAEITISPPTAAVIIVEPGAVYDAGRVCFFAEESGTYTYTVIATGECGADTCQVTFEVTIDETPQITCPPSDAIHLCVPDTIGVPLTISPAGVDVTITPPAVFEDGQLKFYPEEAGDYCFEIIAANNCGADTCNFCITVTIDSPPQATIADSSVFQCSLEEICIPFSYFDPDGNIAGVTVFPVEYSIVNGMVCFTPPDTGIYDIILTVTDSCGNSAADTALVTVTLNHPPTVAMNDTTVYLCEPTDVCIPVAIADPEGAIDSVIVDAPAYYDDINGVICLPVSAEGEYTVAVTVYDGCGETAAASAVITAVLDSPPQIVCPPSDTMHLCSPDSIRVPLAISPADADITITPPASYADGILAFYVEADGEYCFEVIAENTCGADTCTFCITATVDSPPQVTIADSSVYLCELEEICVPYSYFDADNNVVSVTVEPIRYDIVEGFVCFTPPDAGSYDIILTVTDSCGNSDADTTTITVTLNQPPVVSVGDTAVFLCEPGDVCLPVTFSDPDGTVDSVVAGVPAYYDADSQWVCFPVSVSGRFEVPVTVYDTCGASTTATGLILAVVNSVPHVTVPNDTSMILCDTVEICLDGFAFTDTDDNIETIEFIPDIGAYGAGRYCFTPDSAGTYCFIARAIDRCGAAGEDTVCVSIDWGENAVIDCPTGPLADTICEPDSICIPIAVQPVIAKVDILESTGVYVGGSLCFYADSSGSYTFTMVATGECDADTCLVTVDVTLDEAPVITCPTPEPVFLCEADSVSIPLTITPPTAEVTITPPAVYENGQLRFYADKDGDVCFEVIASTICGADTCEFCVTVSLNDPPTVHVPDATVILCQLQEVCIPIDYFDPNGNIESFVVEPDTFTIVNDSICFNPSVDKSIYEIIVTVIDSCGTQSVDTGTIEISLNTKPTVAFGEFESPMSLCGLEQICIPVIIEDLDDNIVNIFVGSTCGDPVINDAHDSLCWIPTSFGTCTLTVLVEDICGESDTAMAEIILIESPYPDPPCPDDDTVIVCTPAQVCLDLGDIQPGHHFVVKPPMYTIFPEQGTLCYTAIENRTDTITIIDSTECGVDSCSFILTTLINRPPVISAEAPPEIQFCHSTTLCIEYTVEDPDNNIDTVIVSGDCPGAVVDIINSRVCLDIATSLDCDLHLIVIDDCDLADTVVLPIVAEPNRPPSISLPIIETVVRCESDTSAIVIADICVSDPDYDEVTLALDSGLGGFEFNPIFNCGELTFKPPTNDTAEYCFKFMATDYCDTVYELFCIDVLPSAICSTCVEVAIEGPPCVNSGGRAIVNITAETFNSIGGYDLLIGYDASALGFIRADIGNAINGWEYFTYRFGDLGNCQSPCPSGLLKLVAIADVNNGPFHPPTEQLTPAGVIATITFRVTSDLNFGGQRIPVNFFWTDCTDNAFSDPTGQYLYVDHIIFSPEGNIVWDELNDDVYPEAERPLHIGTPDECMVGGKYTPVRCVSFHNGDVCIQHPDSIDRRGDMNLNGVPYEIADAVVYTNYFIRGLDAFTISVAGQIAASDINADGLTLSIADLVYLIRVIVGDAPPYPKPIVESAVVTASCTQQDGEASVTVRSEYDIGGVLMIFSGNDVESAVPRLAEDACDMEMKYGYTSGTLRVLLYSMKPGVKIASGVSELVRLNVSGDAEIKLTEIELADYYGRALAVEVSNAILPDQLQLTQNRPNPFNPNTTFELALPKASDYTMTIYNITGQVIRRWTGYSEPGYVTFEWDGRDQYGQPVASGIYFYRAEALGQDAIRKMILLK